MFNEEDNWSNASDDKMSLSSADRDKHTSSDDDDYFDADPFQRGKREEEKKKRRLQDKQTTNTTATFKQKQFNSDAVPDSILPASAQLRNTQKQQLQRPENSIKTLSAVPQPQSTRVAGFHKPGDDEFSLVAIPPEHLLNREGENSAKKQNKQHQSLNHDHKIKNNNNKTKSFSGNDSHGIGSSVWAGSECRCLRCEILRTSQRWALNDRIASRRDFATTVTTTNRNPLLLVLLDADNFAFPSFSRKPPSHTLYQYMLQNTNGVFVWAFYGANFENAFKVDLEIFVRKSYHPNSSASQQDVNEKNNLNSSNNHNSHNNISNSNDNKFPRQLSTWGLLQSRKSVQCTRCEGSPQAADLVIEAVATMIAGEVDKIRCVLLTGDRGLQRSVGEIWAKARGGGGGGGGHEGDDLSTTTKQEHSSNDDSSSPTASNKSFFVPDCAELLKQHQMKQQENQQQQQPPAPLDADIIWRTVFSGFSDKNKVATMKGKYGNAQRRARE